MTIGFDRIAVLVCFVIVQLFVWWRSPRVQLWNRLNLVLYMLMLAVAWPYCVIFLLLDGLIPAPVHVVVWSVLISDISIMVINTLAEVRRTGRQLRELQEQFVCARTGAEPNDLCARAIAEAAHTTHWWRDDGGRQRVCPGWFADSGLPGAHTPPPSVGQQRPAAPVSGQP